MAQPLSVGKGKRRGFAASLSLAIIGAGALIMAATAASLYITENRETINRASMVQARMSALSCGEIAMLRLKDSTGYNGNENISTGGISCLIETVTKNGSAATVYSQSTVNGFKSRLKVEIQSVSNLFITSWTEVP